ncbi:hypothetical protein FA15DRAFT_660345 [Coprinopsis marcescibilis]|uniref:CHAT domain-containing protein n=1 Tax=Coprinopsis marcescibilis TaxID=230819 RepID=A0A5C3KGC0_COPMA|nr:hypothetical protein FA15DRAFT_660345 [Coprinopsis marcescibilis]
MDPLDAKAQDGANTGHQELNPKAGILRETVDILTKAINNTRQQSDGKPLDQAISLLREGFQGEIDLKQRAVTKCALTRVLSVRFAAQGWVEDWDRCAACFMGAEVEERVYMVRIRAQHWEAQPAQLIAFLESVPPALTQLEEYRKAVDISGIDDAIAAAQTTLESAPSFNLDTRELLLAVGRAIVIHIQQKADGQNKDPLAYIRAISLGNIAWLQVMECGLKERLEEVPRYGWELRWKTGKALDEAISHLSASLLNRPLSHSKRPNTLNNLAFALTLRFQQKEDVADLGKAIAVRRELLELTQPFHPDRYSTCAGLVGDLSTRFQLLGKLTDLDECIAVGEEAMSLASDTSEKAQVALVRILGTAFANRFKRRKKPSDLDKCIHIRRRSLAHGVPTDPKRSSSLDNIAIDLFSRFLTNGDPRDLEECISSRRESLDLKEDHDDTLPALLRNLGIALVARFRRGGEIHDLEESLNFHRQSLGLLEEPHPDRQSSLHNLATTLLVSFDHNGNLGHLEEYILPQREALGNNHPGPRNWTRSSSYDACATALHSRWKHRGDFRDLEECILLHREALALHPEPSQTRSVSLNNLANALSTRFQQAHVPQDLEESISLFRESLAAKSPEHPGRPAFLSNLANALSDRSNMIGNPDAEATTTPPPLHLLGSYAAAQFGTSIRFGNREHFHKALKLYRAACTCETGSLLERLRIAGQWADCYDDPPFALEAHRHAMVLLPLLSSLDLTLVQRQNVLVHAKELTNRAARCAIECGELEAAVVFLSTGRSIFWTQILQLRTPIDHLESVEPSLAQELRKVSSQLEAAAHGTGNGSKPGNVGSLGEEATLPKDAFELLERREELIGRPLTFGSLKNAADNSPIVFLNASEGGCDAIIMQKGGNLAHVPLVNMGWEMLKELKTNLQRLVEGDCVQPSVNGSSRSSLDEGDTRLKGFRKGLTKPSVDEDFKVILHCLWVNVVEPVVKVLRLRKVHAPPRLWWCPMGPFAFLPIHAAGIYSDETNDYIYDYAVSSYCYTPQALIAPMSESQPVSRWSL